MQLGDRLRNFRARYGFTQQDLADRICVTKITVVRWENGTSKPSPLAAAKLEQLGFGRLARDQTKEASIPRIDLPRSTTQSLRKGIQAKLKVGTNQYAFSPAPYVTNGPADQLPFFDRLYQLQETSRLADTATEYARRLSAVSSVEDLCDSTAQSMLEGPSPTARHWDSNYGPHGWHRYVGRFPPHVVRGLLNHFGVAPTQIVCDPFAGSGTTLVEARLLGLRSVGIEISPLSCLISRTKSQFPLEVAPLEGLLFHFDSFYHDRWRDFLRGRKAGIIRHEDVLNRPGNLVPAFPNFEKWLTPSALLGLSIVVEFASQHTGYLRDFVCCALSARMRSIGNVDVDVVRAEYRKTPRQNVDVFALVQRTMRKYISDIERSKSSHEGLITAGESVRLIEGSALEVNIEPASIDAIVTSPPYGVESLSYFRTHLLSFRCLEPFLAYDPYAHNDKVIGSEYSNGSTSIANVSAIEPQSPTFVKFFGVRDPEPANLAHRRIGMMQFFEGMAEVADRFARWLRPMGRLAFVIGNKRLGDRVIPTDTIIGELFRAKGLHLDEVITHKLKSNNSNSEVPWQERIIQDEHVMLFTNGG